MFRFAFPRFSLAILDFLNILKRRALCISGVVDSSMPFFPCDLPFPEVLRSPKEPLSRRRAARFRVNQKAMCIVNEFVAAYSFFELGCPSDASWEPKVGPARSHPLVRKLADGLLSQVRHFVRSGVSSPGSLDGGLLSVHECLRSFSVSMYGSKFDSDTNPKINALLVF